MALIFEWDPDKARRNADKHGVTFEEAKTVFNDPNLLTYPDIDHSILEERYLNIGMSSQIHMLVVIHTERDDNVIRIISCRRATTSEAKTYEESLS